MKHTISETWILAIAIHLCLGLTAQSSNAGISAQDYMALHGEEAVFWRTTWNIVTATVDSVSNTPTTNGNPPRIHLRIEQALRGKRLPGSHVALWMPPSNDIDYVDEHSAARQSAWEAIPLPGPKPGTRWILALVPDSILSIAPVGRFPYSLDRLAWAREAINRSHADYIKALERERQQTEFIKAEMGKQKVLEDRFLSISKSWDERDVDSTLILDLFARSTFVGIADFGWHVNMPEWAFAVRRILKGTAYPETPDVNGYNINVRLDPGVSWGFYKDLQGIRDRKFILFLDQGAWSNERNQMPHYNLIDQDFGLIPLTRAREKLVQRLERH